MFDIQKFSIHDGPGIRTTVFLKGCPLKCAWCHNPESQERGVEISFLPDRCIGCGFCFKVCPYGCHSMEDGVHVFNREKCDRCALCTEECYAQALEVVGKTMTVVEVIDEVMKDEPFYKTSGGGMTLSGGEPLFQAEFSLSLLREAKNRGLHTCIETSGHGSYATIEKMRELVDIFLFDFKESDPDKHREFTGVDNRLILKNLYKLGATDAEIFLRCPIIPGLNDRENHLDAIADLANDIGTIQQIDILPYHPLGKSKSDRIGKQYPLDDKPFAEENEVNRWIGRVQSRTETPVKKN